MAGSWRPADEDGAIRLGDVASREQIGSQLAANNTAVDAIAFSPDGLILAARRTAARSGCGEWPLTHDIVNRVCAIADGSMTRQQWSSYVKAELFQATCP